MGELGVQGRLVVLRGLGHALIDGRRVGLWECLLEEPEGEADRRKKEVGEGALEWRDRIARLSVQRFSLVELNVRAVAPDNAALDELIIGKVDAGLMDDAEHGEEGRDAARDGSVEPLAVDRIHEDAAPEHGVEQVPVLHQGEADCHLAAVVGYGEVVDPREEEAEEEDDVVALRDDSGALLREHKAKDEDRRTIGNLDMPSALMV